LISRVAGICAVLLGLLPTLGSADPLQNRHSLAAAVFKVRAVEASGKTRNGSAVLVAPGKLVTTCHVTHNAQAIELAQEGASWPAQEAFVDTGHDVCVLSAPALSRAIPAVLGVPDQLKLGDVVIAVGYPRGGSLTLASGTIKGLHPYEGARVLQVSAPFEQGASGGALFDAQGRLVGITAFKAVGGGDFHFALPLQWLSEHTLQNPSWISASDEAREAFWQRPRDRQPLFLQAASLEADGKWQALSHVAQEWVRADHANPASWLALGRAFVRLNRIDQAAQAFHRATTLVQSALQQP